MAAKKLSGKPEIHSSANPCAQRTDACPGILSAANKSVLSRAGGRRVDAGL
jgi:hypothetical protein